MQSRKFDISSLNSWLLAIILHTVAFLMAVFLQLFHHNNTVQIVEVGLIPIENQQQTLKEKFKSNPAKEQSSAKEKTRKKILPDNTKEDKPVKDAKPGSAGGSTQGFEKGDGDANIKTGGTGTGYGIGSGGQGGAEDNVYRVAVDEMPEPYGGVSGILSKVKISEETKQVSGSVYVLCFIDESGAVRRARITKGLNPDYDAAALLAIKRSRFKPGKEHGRPVKVQMVINLGFEKN